MSEERSSRSFLDVITVLGLADHVVGFLHAAEAACTFPLINKACRDAYTGTRTVLLSQPVPHHAFVWRWGRPEATRDLTRAQRLTLLSLTAQSGSLENLEVAAAAAGCILEQRTVMDAAASGGHLHVCRMLSARFCPVSFSTAFAAAAAGQLDAVRWVLCENKVLHSATRGLWGAAARGGHRHVCEWLLAEGFLCSHVAEVMCTAAGLGHVDLLDWLLDTLPANLDDDGLIHVVRGALEGCSLETVRRLSDRLGVPDCCVMAVRQRLPDLVAAAVSSRLSDWRDKLQWVETRFGTCPLSQLAPVEEILKRHDHMDRLQALQQRGPLGQLRHLIKTVMEAARLGQLPVLRLLLLQPSDDGRGGESSLTSDAKHAVVGLAANKGHLEVLEELAARGWPVRTDTVLDAAVCGCLTTLKWAAAAPAAPAVWRDALQGALQLRDGAELVEHAACSGSLELVMWLRQQQECAWDERAFWAAVQFGDVALLQWMVEQGCPMGDPVELLAHAAITGDLATLRCLRRLGCPWGPRTDGTGVFARALADRARFAVLRWLVAEGCPVDWGLAAEAVVARNDPEGVAIREWVGGHLPVGGHVGEASRGAQPQP